MLVLLNPAEGRYWSIVVGLPSSTGAPEEEDYLRPLGAPEMRRSAGIFSTVTPACSVVWFG